jgi:hypothetical protein
MAMGIEEGSGGRPVISYHPAHFGSSGTWLQTETWLDFNMIQSGHSRPDIETWEMITYERGRKPAKPVIDAEPNYEDTPINWTPVTGYFGDYDVRKQAYRAVFAGAFGATYGHASIWQLYLPSRPLDASWAGFQPRDGLSWRQALSRPGAVQMTHLRRLIESRPMLTRIPDQSLLGPSAGTGARRAQATRSSDGSYAMVYIPTAQQTVTVRLDALSGDMVRAWWYDPRNGSATVIGEFGRAGTQSFTTASHGADWVLVLDDAARGFPPPGSAAPR